VAAQKQHYVPQFILRQFLSEKDGERVAVYDKHDDKTFVTSIKNIMAERRFNDFAFGDEYIASFEPMASRAEDQVLPAYRQVIEERRLDGSVEQTGALAMLVAFQFLRAKASRQMWADMEEMVVEAVESSGGRMQDVEGWSDWQPATEDSLKRNHLTSIQDSLLEFSQIIAEKDFLLAEAASGRSFYLGDNPVGLANDNDFGPYGNIGLGVRGIQIYLPLTADLMLCAWCPSILGEIRERLAASKTESRGEALRRVMAGQLTPAQMKAAIEKIEALEAPHEALLAAAAEGRPITSSSDNMDYYNSIQTRSAVRYIVCQQADFELARRFNRENPKFRRGHRMRNAATG
jgi:hypothetical protein